MRRTRHALMMILLLISFQSLSLAQGRTIYVDESYRGEIEDGSRLRPYKTVTKAMAAAFDGDTILVQAGIYPEVCRLNKRVLDRVTRHEYLKTPPSSFFEFAVNNGKSYQSNNGIVVDDGSRAPDGSEVVINAHATEVPLAFRHQRF